MTKAKYFKRDRWGNSHWTDIQGLYLWKFSYKRALVNGNLDPTDTTEYKVHIIGKSLEDCVAFVQERLDQPILLTEQNEGHRVDFVADADFSKELERWKNSHDVSLQIARGKFDYYKRMQKGEVEKPKSKTGSINLSAW